MSLPENEFDSFVKKAFNQMTQSLGKNVIMPNFIVVAEPVDKEYSDIAISLSGGMTP